MTGAPELLCWQIEIVQVTSKLSCSLRVQGPGQRGNWKKPRIQDTCFAGNYVGPFQSAKDIFLCKQRICKPANKTPEDAWKPPYCLRNPWKTVHHKEIYIDHIFALTVSGSQQFLGW